VETAGKSDEIGTPIVVEVGDHDLVSALEVARDGVFDEGGRGGGEQGKGEEERKQTAHAPQYTDNQRR
jgi:hypothetical protein